MEETTGPFPDFIACHGWLLLYWNYPSISVFMYINDNETNFIPVIMQ